MLTIIHDMIIAALATGVVGLLGWMGICIHHILKKD
jgi:hypothetical protein